MFHVKQHPIFSFCNQKGGVGKTTTAINFGSALAQNGYQTLLIDMDPQGNATSGLGEEKNGDFPTLYEVLTGAEKVQNAIKTSQYSNLSILPANSHLSGAEVELISLPEREFYLKKYLEEIRSSFDFIFIDCPPSLGLLTINALTASDFLLIPLQCEYYALEGLGQLLETFSLVQQKLNPSLEIGGVLLTMADFRTKLTEQVIDEVRKYFNKNVFKTIIPRSVRLSEAPSFGQPGVVYDKSSRGAKSYWEATREFIEKFAASKPSEKESALTGEKTP